MPSYLSYLKNVFDWDEGEHPRVPAGSSEGGQFTSGGGEFKNSKVVDANGALKKVYHGTMSDFIKNGEGFSVSRNIGFHFGTKEAAKQRTQGRGIEYAAYLNITNPLKLDFDLEEWGGYYLINTLYNKGILTEEQIKPIMEYRTTGIIDDDDYNSESNEIARKILEDAGYDGIEYINAVEDKGSISYIVFRPEQIKVIKED